MRNTIKYVLAVSSAVVVCASSMLLVSAKPAHAAVLCTNSACSGHDICIRLRGASCFSGGSSCQTVKCP